MKNVLLIGKPNCGKSLLFQKVTGMYQKVANYPGVTTEIKRGEKGGLAWIDFPGTYSLNPITQDEEFAVGKLKLELEKNVDKIIVCLLDVTQLERSLVLALQLLELATKFKTPIIFAVNMMDEIKNINSKINLKGLEQAVGVPILGISAKTKEGIDELIEKINHHSLVPSLKLNSDFITAAKELTEKFGTQDLTLIKLQNKFDKIFLSNIFGGLIFAFIMLLLFQSIFTLATPLMDGTESVIIALGTWISGFLSEGVFKDFVNDAIFGGLGSFFVFAPQIAVLTFVIGVLEDSGYLARATIIGHLPLKFFGLSGKSFVPYLSGHACAIPAIMAARTIESPRKRLLTIITIPFTSCSARLPVYSLLIIAFIPATEILGGFLTYQGLAFFVLYSMGIFAGLIVSVILNKFLPKQIDDAPFIIELPRYRIPSWQPLFRRSFNSAWAFIVRAGPVIFMVNLIVWLLGYFPQNEDGLSGSYLASLGHFINPIFEPLGVDWRYGVAILVSFLAREVFVGTLGTLFGIEGADEDLDSLADKIQADGLSFASGLGLLVFYALALQCVSTLAVIKSETGSKKLPVLMFIFYTMIAYVSAVTTYQLFS